MAERVDPECPASSILRDFAAGRAERRVAAQVEAHVVTCARCAAKVGELGASRAAARADEATDALGATLRASRNAPDPVLALAPGEQVGRYQILRGIGAGAMGVVYAALDLALERRVALKLMRHDFDEPDEVMASRLMREAKAMARLSHPNVVTVFDAGKIEGHVFVAMELIDGQTLREWLGERTRSVSEILDVFLAAAHGLAAAHEAGLVHRDFKPDNVLVRHDGRVCVTDFGLARLRDGAPLEIPQKARSDPAPIDPSLTRSGVLIGTPAYMAPEQLEGLAADASSDLFAFCVALYEALFQQRPFAGRALHELHANVRAGKIAPLERPSHVPNTIRETLLEGLRPEPRERPAGMAELIARLGRARRGTGASRLRALRLASIAAGVAIGATALVAATRGCRAQAVDAAKPATSGCTTHRACVEAHGGAPFACRPSDHACVPIASPDCVASFEPQDLAYDDLVWLGVLLPTTGSAAEAYGRMNVEGAELARHEIALATRALGGESASHRVRRVGLVTCDDAIDARRAARHLVEDVGVPAIAGFGGGQEVVDLAGSLLVRSGVLSVSTLTPSPLITRVPQPAGLPPMVWRTTFSFDDMARVVARFVRELLATRSRPALSALRVAIVHSDTPSAMSFADAFYKRFAADGDARGYAETTFSAGALGPADVARIAGSVAAAAPTFVVLFDDALVLPEAIEGRWPAGTAHPTYLLPNSSTAKLAAFIGTSVDRRRRVLAVNSDSSSEPNARFVVRFNAAHADAGVSLTMNPSPTYDAVYLLAYATFTLGDAPVTGPSLAGAFRRLLPPAEPIEVGPLPMFDALRALAAGTSIDLEGAASHLDFDPSTGEAPNDFSLNCSDVDVAGRAAGEIESGVYYRARGDRIEGTLRCP